MPLFFRDHLIESFRESGLSWPQSQGGGGGACDGAKHYEAQVTDEGAWLLTLLLVLWCRLLRQFIVDTARAVCFLSNDTLVGVGGWMEGRKGQGQRQRHSHEGMNHNQNYLTNQPTIINRIMVSFATFRCQCYDGGGWMIIMVMGTRKKERQRDLLLIDDWSRSRTRHIRGRMIII